MTKQLSILILLLSGCATAPVSERNTIRVHLYDELQNNSSTGVDPKSLFVVVGKTVITSPHVTITPVPTACQQYPLAGVDEYYIDVDLSGISRFDLSEVYLFHSDLVGNKGMLRLRTGWCCPPQWVTVPEQRQAAVRWRLFCKMSSQYRSLDDVPQHTRDFMTYYGWMDATHFR